MRLSRRKLLQRGLLATPLAAGTFLFSGEGPAAPAQSAAPPRADQSRSDTTPAYIVRAGESRAGEPWKALGAPHFWVKISGTDVGGRLAMIECTTPAGAGPPVHVHEDQNEFMYIVEGSFGIQVSGRRAVLKAGDCYMVPRGTPHAYVVLGTQPARHLNLYDPAAKIEAFFESYDRAHPSKPATGAAPPLGPPLKPSDFP